MAKTTAKEIRALSEKEVSMRLRNLKQEVLNLRLQQATGQLENSARLNLARKEIARILTVTTEKERAKA